MTEYDILIDFLVENLSEVEHSGGGGLNLEFPDFELMPFDYLEFAEQSLEDHSISSRIGCVSNIKRATECEMDTLIHVLGLSKYVRSFPKKLELVQKLGLVSPRSLEKLNRIRNKMEHEYSIPDLEELQVYFDLASGFVHSLEGYMFMLANLANQQWYRGDFSDHEIMLNLDISCDPARIKFKIKLEGQDDFKELLFYPGDLDIYLAVLRICFLLCRATGLVSNRYVMAKLKNESIDVRLKEK